MKRDADPHKATTELLRQSEERFVRLAEQLPAITYVVELLPEPHTVYISPQVKSMLGFTQEEWLSSPDFWTRQLAPEDREQVIRDVREHNETGESFFLEYRIATREGKQLWIRNSATYQRNEQGRPATVYGVMQDITEKKIAERALRDSELRFRHLLQELESIAIQGYGPDGTTHYWNQASERLYGYTAEEAIGQNLVDLIIPPEMKEEVQKSIQTMKSRGEPIPAQELSLMRKDGSRVSVHSSHVIVQPPGLPPELFCVDIDLTGSQEADRARQQSEERYKELHKLLRSVADVMPDMLWAKDLDRKYIFANRAMCEGLLYARDTEEPIGKTDLFFAQRERASHPDNPDWHTFGEICADSDSLVLDSGTTHQFEESGNVRGKFLLLDVIKTPLRNEQGEMIGTVGAGRDITEQKQAEHDKKTLQVQLLQAQKLESVGRLAGGVAHDFNNMLQAIFGHAELALDDLPPGSPAYENLEEIRKTAQRSADLTKQLLAFARKQAVAPRVLDLNETIHGMLKMLKRLIGEGIQLEWTPQAGLPPVKIDPSQVDQILVNLCLNARDSVVGEGRVSLKTDVAVFDKSYCLTHAGYMPGRFVHLTVRDNGQGMEPEVLEHIFEPFFSTKGMGRGTGLGLATVYGIVQQNQGMIHAQSEKGQGTAFHIYLPQDPGWGNPLEEPESPPAIPQGRETLLIAEDDEDILNVTSKMLKQKGYTVLGASSPNEAIRIAGDYAGNIDLLISDVVMPEMNGHTLAKKLMALYPDMKCLFMSGYTADIIASQGILNEGVHFFKKPFTRQELTAKVRMVLDSG